MQVKILFWFAVGMGVTGMLSPEGHLYYFIAVHSSMLMIGCSLQRREKRGRATSPAKSNSAKPTVSSPKTKTA